MPAPVGAARGVSIRTCDRFVADIVALADHTDDPDIVAAVTRDPNDDYLVALAVNSAAVICTGDRDLHDPEAHYPTSGPVRRTTELTCSFRVTNTRPRGGPRTMGPGPQLQRGP